MGHSESRSPASSGSTPSALTDSASQATQPIPKKSQQIKTDKPRPHMCTICTRAFARLEHLKRHERSHTNEKPFQCAACGRCFARRDLVLRHQQKLHTSLPNIMRRGSSKDLDEHINVLHNNTENSAPLPNGASPDLGGDTGSNDGTNFDDSGPPTQLYSPPKTNELNYNSNGSNSNNGSAPQFRTALFNNTASFNTTASLPANNSIPSPIPTNSSQNTPPGVTLPSSTVPSSNLKRNSVDKFLQDKTSYYGKTTQFSHLLGSQTRHASFSAVSGSSYTNLKDAKSIQQSNLTAFGDSFGTDFTPHFTGSDELTSKNLLLSGLDLNSLGNMDWSNLDGLDLSSATDRNKGAGSPSFSQLTAKQRSLKNLQQFFLDNMSTTNNNHNGNNHNGNRSNNNNNTSNGNDNPIAALQFNNPNHPHHLKGMTPFEYGLNPPNFNMEHAQSVLDEEPNESITLQNDIVESKKAQKKQKKQISNQPNKKVKLEKDATDTNGSPYSTVPDIKTEEFNGTTSANMHAISLNMTQDDDWLKEIINTPYETNFPVASHQIGFMEVPSLMGSPKLAALIPPTLLSNPGNLGEPNEISSLFRSRQIDLVNQMNPKLPRQEQNNHGFPGIQRSSTANGNGFTPMGVDVALNLGTAAHNDYAFITEDFRKRIINISNISDAQFPTVEDLNHYMRLYELEFNKYFPFIHLPSLKNPMVEKFEDIPLLLSMASIGALYAYHDTNTILLFSLSKFHIQNFFEKEITLDNLQFKKVPLMAHQCLVLHIFITLFFDEPNMMEITAKQMKSMIGLIKSTNFNESLENFLIPPPSMAQLDLSSHEATQVIQNNFDYFIMAQSRIRTMHVFYMLSSFRSSMGGLQIYCDSSLLKSGNHCIDELLWKSETSLEWYNNMKSRKLEKLIDMSNGRTFNELITYLVDNNPRATRSPLGLSFYNLLSLLMYVHETVQKEYAQVKQPFSYLDWKLKHKPRLDSLVKSWEQKFVANKGTLNIDSSNAHLLNLNNEFKLILPLYYMIKIKLIINLNPIIPNVFTKNWTEMNAQLNLLGVHEAKYENMKQSLPYCIEIIQLWTYNIKCINNDDMKQCSLRSPVFFVSCLFLSILIVSSYVNVLESKIGHQALNEMELIQWIECESVLLKVEEVLSPLLKSSYSELLTQQGTTFKYIRQDDGLKKVRKLIEKKEAYGEDSNKEVKQIEQEIEKEILTDKLSIKSLYLGIRILADAPVWPVAMGFAEALKSRAAYLTGHKKP